MIIGRGIPYLLSLLFKWAQEAGPNKRLRQCVSYYHISAAAQQAQLDEAHASASPANILADEEYVFLKVDSPSGALVRIGNQDGTRTTGRVTYGGPAIFLNMLFDAFDGLSGQCTAYCIRRKLFAS